MKDERDIRVLCKKCRNHYWDTGAFRVHRVNPTKMEFDGICYNCQILSGYECIVTPIKGKEGRR